jgi:hypothetical protein
MRTTITMISFATALMASGAAFAGSMSNLDYLQAARCRGLAASEGLGKIDTAQIDQLLRSESPAREIAVRSSAARRINAATEAGNKATGAKKDRLLAERANACAPYLSSSARTVASN